jgi:hypothetical protein
MFVASFSLLPKHPTYIPTFANAFCLEKNNNERRTGSLYPEQLFRITQIVKKFKKHQFRTNYWNKRETGYM